MIREAFVVNTEQESIVKVDITNPDGVSWREAKKQLREVFMNKARALRAVTQKDYFNNVPF